MRFYCDFFFFFQAEDGIRDPLVTGVQTCALPICATTVISTDPGVAENESVKPPSGVMTTMRPFTVMVDPGSVVPTTTTFFASTVLPVAGCVTVMVGGVRSSTTLYDDAATTSRSAMSATAIEFAPSLSASVALNAPLASSSVVATTEPLSTNCT